MSYEALELATFFESCKRALSAEIPGLDWHIDIIEKDPYIVKVLENQRFLAIVYDNDISDDERRYIDGFLPGAHRHRLTLDEHESAVFLMVPKYYRDRIRISAEDIEIAKIKPDSYGVSLCLMGNKYLKGEKAVVDKLLLGLKDKGLILTDCDVDEKKLRTKCIRIGSPEHHLLSFYLKGLEKK